MITVSVVKRRLKEGKTYEDFRKAWYHTVGFGTKCKLYTSINVRDPREIIVIAFAELTLENASKTLDIDIKERTVNTLDDVIEPDIGRSFSVMISEDDFSGVGDTQYQSPSIDGQETNLPEIFDEISHMKDIVEAAAERRKKASLT
jgi:hypothetical protein